MAKLRCQFAELLADAGILRAGGATALSAGQGARSRHRRHHRHRGGSAGALRGAELHAAKRRLRAMQADMERQRGRKVLKVARGAAGGGGGEAAGGEKEAASESASSSSGEEELERLHDLDLRVHVDVGSMAAESSQPLSPSDVGLLRHLLAACLYPRLAVGEPDNCQRREQDCRFHTAQVSDLVVHPGSSLYGSSNSLPRGQVLLYQELIETRRQYLSCLTPLWALPALLLAARRIDCDPRVGRWLVDGWLLLRLHDGSGPQVLQQVMHLRASSSHLVATRLRAARLSALAAVQTVEENEEEDGEPPRSGADVAEIGSAGSVQPGSVPGSGSSGSEVSAAFQKGYSALAAALPEELRPLLDGVVRQQATWRQQAAAARQRRQEREDDDVDGNEEEEGKDGEGAGGAAAAMARDAELEDELARKLSLDMWPCRYSLERLPPGNKVTAQYDIPELTANQPQMQAPQPSQQQQEQVAQQQQPQQP
ncbi:hypothetical protein Agub_g15722, partial [Astrephomene gubernaculifera]